MPADGTLLHHADPARAGKEETAVCLRGLATALPPHKLDQDDVKERARAIFGDRYPHFDRIAASFDSAGIDTRHSIVPLDWFEKSRGWSDRNDAYLEGATSMFVQAAEAALKDADWRAADVDIVVTVSSTGIATPSLEARAHDAVGFRDDIMRVPVFGLGCAGGVSGLSMARTLAAGRPGAKVLLVVVEACSVAFRADRGRKSDIIAAILFGDGAAAVALSTGTNDGRGHVILGNGVQQMWPDTLDIMGWDVDDTGFGVVFDRSIPDFVCSEFREATQRALAATGWDMADVDRQICHPGGAKVVEAIESTLGLPDGSLDIERDVLRGVGNMSAPTVLFVLDAALKAGAKGRLMAAALGPGFTASFLPMEVSR
ncbi:MAG: type III polyketide synthase [Roseovarius sp.]|jgi:alkylresorcinol/alkylpyrone synthase|nr:type III polyketide synthase [Roseovarius sp.]